MFVVGNGRGGRFPSKKAIKEHVAAGGSLDLIDTGLFGSDGTCSTDTAELGRRYTFVGPTEYKRVFYGNVVVAEKNGKRVVKVS